MKWDEPLEELREMSYERNGAEYFEMSEMDLPGNGTSNRNILKCRKWTV
jgi:hypothetical protein